MNSSSLSSQAVHVYFDIRHMEDWGRGDALKDIRQIIAYKLFTWEVCRIEREKSNVILEQNFVWLKEFSCLTLTCWNIYLIL